PTPLPFDRPATAHVAGDAAPSAIELDEDDTRRLVELARRHRVTLNAVIQGAWALLLSRLSGQRDVCFGATVAGRAADLPGAESMTGIFIGTLPVRVSVDDGARVGEWLQALQTAQTEARRHEQVALARLATWSDVPGGIGLFDTIVVFENYPID